MSLIALATHAPVARSPPGGTDPALRPGGGGGGVGFIGRGGDGGGWSGRMWPPPTATGDRDTGAYDRAGVGCSSVVIIVAATASGLVIRAESAGRTVGVRALAVPEPIGGVRAEV